MQYGSPNATLDSCCQTVSIVTSRWTHLSHIIYHSIELCAGEFLSTVVFNQLHCYAMAYADKHNIVSIVEQLPTSRLILQSDGFPHRSHLGSRKFRTKNTLALFLTV